MRYVLLLIFIFLFCGVGRAQRLEIHHLTDNFYIFTTYRDFKGTPFPSNGLYLVTDEGVLLIDSPWDTTQFQPLLDTIEMRHHKKVLWCIATHAHDDRTAGLEYYAAQAIRTYTTRQTDRIAAQKGEKRARFLIEKDTTFKVGDYQFQTYFAGAGHTPDNIVIWFEKYKILYGGCLIKSTEANGLGNLADAQVSAWEQTMLNLLRHFRRAQYVIPGHHGWKNPKAMQHTLQLVREHLKKKSMISEKNQK